MSNPSVEFDSPWKEALDLYLADFLALAFPEVHAAIDWSRPPLSLDAELRQVLRDAAMGERAADKLVQVWLRDGAEVWVLLHIEVQTRERADFAERMFVYHYRIFDRHRRPVASLAVLGDERPAWRPAEYRRELWGCAVHFQYPIVKLADYRARQEELEASTNPFTTVVLAHLAAQDTRRDPAGRARRKIALTRRLYERGYGRDEVLSLYRFIDWLLELPAAAEAQVQQAIHQIEEELGMPHITSAERIGLERGLAQGREEGREEGRQEGLREAVTLLLTARLGPLDQEAQAVLARADAQTLAGLLTQAATASPDELRAALGLT